MKKIMIPLAALLFLLGGCAPDRPPTGEVGESEPVFNSLAEESFETSSGTLRQHSAWASREADFFLEGGVWKLKASGTHISESWKAYAETLPSERDWSVAVDVTVPRFWDTMDTEDAQVGAGVFVGKLDPDGKSRTVYETNLAAIARQERFVQGQLIKNRLGDDPIAVGFMKTDRETATLEISYESASHTILFFMDGILVDVKHIDHKGIDDWDMAENRFMVGVMGFAENTDITGHFPSVDNFVIKIRD